MDCSYGTDLFLPSTHQTWEGCRVSFYAHSFESVPSIDA